MSDEDDTEKEHEPTQKKLDDARKKGEVAKSTDLITAAAYGGMLLTIMVFGGSTLSQSGEAMANMIGRASTLSEDWFAGGASPLSFQVIKSTTFPLAAWFYIPAALVLLCVIVQRAFIVAPDKLIPKLSRISPISNAKNKFGRAGLFEFFKSTVKLTIYSIVLGIFLTRELDLIVSVMSFQYMTVLAVLSKITIEFIAVVFVVATVIGGIDLVFQIDEHQRKNRMSRKEMTDESKESEGDPHMKHQRRQKGYDIAMNQMLAEVPTADVIIVNPTHYAVALKWNRTPGSAPECVAKGVDEIAARIREIAAEEAIPIHSDPPAARAIYATVDIGDEIQAEHFQAVAAAIRFSEAMRKKAKSRI